MKRPERSRTHHLIARDWFPNNAGAWTWRDVFDWFCVKRPPQSNRAWAARTALTFFVLDDSPCLREVEA